jgi:uroporphyrinogen III methyltransferase/synthase
MTGVDPVREAAAELPFGGDAARPGTVALVGAGPGDPGLITLRAARLLATATFVAHDRLAPAAALAMCRDDAELLDVGKQPDRHKLSQDEINQELVAAARTGHAVVRWKGGDPFVLARGSEEAQACRAAGVPVEVVPGITSGVAAPAYAGIPATHRGLAPGFAVVTGHEDPATATQVDYAALAAFPGTLLVYMGVGRIRAIADALMSAGRRGDEAVALVRWGTTPRQEVLSATLATVADEVQARGFAAPAVAVVGDVAALRGELSWFDTRELHGHSVVVPRTRQQASALSERLRALGAEPVEAPTIATAASREPQRLAAAAGELRDRAYDWVALTSPNGVAALLDAVAAAGGDARWLAGARVAAVGTGTAAALADRGVRADLIPQRFTTRGLAAALMSADAPSRVLLPRADLAGPALAEELAQAGWGVEQVEAYRTVPVEALPGEAARRLRDGEVDAVAFPSSSTVRNLVELLGGPPADGVAIVSIGPVTSQACTEVGLRVDAEADPHDLDGLVEAVRRALG